MCRLLSELAQFNSEVFQKSCEKNIQESLEIESNDLEAGFVYKDYLSSHYENESDRVIDREDYYRLRYFAKHNADPINICWTARVGLVEDFFGSWASSEENLSGDEEYFNPNQNGGLPSPLS